MTKTIQEVFDECYTKMVAQGVPATIGGRCVYRDNEGNKCGVGILMTDEQATMCAGYGGGVHTLLTYVRSSGRLGAVPEYFWGDRDMVGFLSDLQTVHDKAAGNANFRHGEFLEDFKRGMRSLARQRGLSDAVINSPI